LLDGAIQRSATCLSVGVPMPLVGGDETVRGVIGEDFVDQLPVPAAFTAATRNT